MPFSTCALIYSFLFQLWPSPPHALLSFAATAESFLFSQQQPQLLQHLSLSSATTASAHAYTSLHIPSPLADTHSVVEEAVADAADVVVVAAAVIAVFAAHVVAAVHAIAFAVVAVADQMFALLISNSEALP